MNFDFNDKEQTFFKDITQLIGDFSQDKNLETNDLQKSNGYIRDALKSLSKTPYLKLGIENPPEIGGMIALLRAMEIVAEKSPSLLLSIEMSTRLFGRILSAWGNEDQKKKLLNPLLDGQILGAVALSESAMNIDNDSLTTEGVADGDDVLVSGEKSYVVNSLISDWVAVVGRLNDEDAVFLLEKDTSGLLIEERLSTLGYDGVVISSLQLKNCRIPKNQVIQPPKEKKMLTTLRQWENQIIMGNSLGIMKAAFESAKEYAKTHKTGGKPIIAYQEVGFKLSEMLTLYQTSQLFAYRTVWSTENEKSDDSLTHCAKVFVTESAESVTSDALQILSGAGYMSGSVAEKGFRCAKYGQIAGTSTEIARVKIGDNALGIRA